MTTKLHWIDDNRSSIWLEFDKRWTWRDFHNATEQANEMIRHAQNRVVLVTWAKSQMPSGSPLTHFVSAARKGTPNLKAVIIIAQDQNQLNSLKNVDQLSSQLNLILVPIKFVGSAEEAEALIPTLI